MFIQHVLFLFFCSIFIPSVITQSGSYQFFTGGEKNCNMQRIISMNPDHFSKHLLYHTANNKQKQIGRVRMVRANNLFGQLNHVRKTAEHEKASMQSMEASM